MRLPISSSTLLTVSPLAPTASFSASTSATKSTLNTSCL